MPTQNGTSMLLSDQRRQSTETPFMIHSSQSSESGDSSDDNSLSSSLEPSSHVFIKDETRGWIPAELLSQTGTSAVVVPSSLPQSSGNQSSRKLNIDLSEYPSHQLPMNHVDEDTGDMVTYNDMCDMPFLHEASILYNMKERYESRDKTDRRFDSGDCVPYTRSGDIVLAVNPYRWIKGLYSEKTRCDYAHKLVWQAIPSARKEISPHVYEASCQAYKGLVMDGQNQSILVSGESGAGKTVSVKILMSHLATFSSTEGMAKLSLEAESNKESLKPPAGEEQPNPSNLLEWAQSGIRHVVASIFSHSDELVKLEQNTDTDESLKCNAEEDALDDEPTNLNQTTDPVIQRVLDSNPLLEAFGNAKTVKNDNSSRFSKYIQLEFHIHEPASSVLLLPPKAEVVGSICETNLLEKNRVVYHALNERTFHIFYQLLAAPEEYRRSVWEEGLVAEPISGEISGSYALPSSFKYVGDVSHSPSLIEGKTDAQRWERTLSALELVGVTGDALRTLLRTLCVALQLGNITFDVDAENEEKSVISSALELEKLAALLGVDAQELSNAFTTRTVVAYKNETFQVPLTPTVAKDVCDAFAKTVYAKMFDWLVASINRATSYSGQNHDQGEDTTTSLSSSRPRYGKIGLLDIFGFERFDTNHFEQLCINHANEKLQQKFTRDIFQSVQQEYTSEGIDLCEVQFVDNSPVLNLLEGRTGLINLLNEECIRPKGSDSGFVNKVYGNSTSSSCSKQEASPLIRNRRYTREEFAVRHYAGVVVYNANQIVHKNMDSLPTNIIDCAITSSNFIIQTKFQELKNQQPEGRGSLVQNTVWTKFKTQLKKLMDNLDQTKTWYVRCINPNATKTPGVLDLPYALSQLRYSGVVSAVTMSRSSFPNTLSFSETWERYLIIASKKDLLTSKKRTGITSFFQRSSSLSEDDIERNQAIRLLDALLPQMEFESSPLDQRTDKKAYDNKAPFVCGKTRVYFRAGALEYLESERISVYDRYATVIQSRARRNFAAKLYNELRVNPPSHKRRGLRLKWWSSFSTVLQRFTVKVVDTFFLLPWRQILKMQRTAVRFFFVRG